MLHTYPFIEKIWNRGINISASVITTAIIGLIGLAFWKAKLKLDLHADRQKREPVQNLQNRRARLSNLLTFARVLGIPSALINWMRFQRTRRLMLSSERK